MNDLLLSLLWLCILSKGKLLVKVSLVFSFEAKTGQRSSAVEMTEMM